MREKVLKGFLVVVGLTFCGTVYPMIVFARTEPALAMMMSLYATLGVCLLLAVRNPGMHRSLITFTAWSSLAHASLMAFQVWRHYIAQKEEMGVAIFGLIGILLLALRPARVEAARASSAGAGF